MDKNSIKIKKILLIIIIILLLPLIPILIKFVFQMGNYIGIFLRNLYYFIVFW